MPVDLQQARLTREINGRPETFEELIPQGRGATYVFRKIISIHIFTKQKSIKKLKGSDV